MRLHNFFRSSTSYRVRIALNLKGLDYEYVAYHLRSGKTREPEYLSLNRQGLVPTLELDDGMVITQSLAIIEYLDEVHPEPRLLPKDPLERSRVRAIAYMIACEIHPIDNLRVLKYLRDTLGHTDHEVKAWFNHWITTTFDSLEEELANDPQTGKFCHGDAPTLADVCLVPQVVNSQRFDLDLSPYPTIQRIFEACQALKPFGDAHPSKQPDAE